MQSIDIVIEPNGDVKVEGKGFAGGDCVKFTKGIEDALGDQTSRVLKPEFRLVAAKKVGAAR